jgi:hypothetical protein
MTHLVVLGLDNRDDAERAAPYDRPGWAASPLQGDSRRTNVD